MTKARELGILGSRAYEKGVLEVAFFLQKGVNASGYKKRGETLVVGGGDDALEAACVAAKGGASKVVVVCQEQTQEMQAAPEKIAEAQELGIRIVHGWAPTHADVYSDGRVSGVFFKHCDRFFDAAGRRAPRYNEGNVMAQYCDNVILADE